MGGRLGDLKIVTLSSIPSGSGLTASREQAAVYWRKRRVFQVGAILISAGFFLACYIASRSGNEQAEKLTFGLSILLWFTSVNVFSATYFRCPNCSITFGRTRTGYCEHCRMTFPKLSDPPQSFRAS